MLVQFSELFPDLVQYWHLRDRGTGRGHSPGTVSSAQRTPTVLLTLDVLHLNQSSCAALQWGLYLLS